MLGNLSMMAQGQMQRVLTGEAVSQPENGRLKSSL